MPRVLGRKPSRTSKPIAMDNQARKELLQSFCETNELRKTMLRPFVVGDKVCATDAHSILLLPATEEDKADYQPQGKVPDVTIYLKQETEFFMYLDLECLKCEREKIQKKVDEIDDKCPDCRGTGRVEYEYYSVHSDRYKLEHTCPVCEGTGERDISNELGEDEYSMPLTEKYKLPIYRMDDIIRALGFFGKQKCALLKQKGTPSVPYHIIEPEFHLIVMPSLRS